MGSGPNWVPAVELGTEAVELGTEAVELIIYWFYAYFPGYVIVVQEEVLYNHPPSNLHKFNYFNYFLLIYLTAPVPNSTAPVPNSTAIGSHFERRSLIRTGTQFGSPVFYSGLRSLACPVISWLFSCF